MNCNEEWKDIKGYEGYYKVSNFGRIKSLLFNREKILKTRYNKTGYELVNLRNKTFRVHSLVAQAFIPNPNNYSEINHKDENKMNNNVSNLEWCDRKYNCRYGSLPHKVSERFRKSVICYPPSKIGKTYFKSLLDAERKTGIDHSSISKCCRGKVKTAGGFHWEYYKNMEIKEYELRYNK